MHEVGEQDGQPYIVMELVEGKPLSELIPADGFPSETVLRYGVQIADGLAHAHERGVIHRDLKSQNVVIAPEGRATVLDFGLAAQMPSADAEAVTKTQAALTPPGVLAGTLAYMPPEVLRGDPATARSDIWALGVLLYEMCGGALPFVGTTQIDVVSAIMKEQPAALRATVSPGLGNVIHHCLAKEPAQRYQHVAAIQAALETLQSGAPPAAPEKGPAPTWERRLPLMAGGLALFVVAATVGYLVRPAESPGGSTLVTLERPTQITRGIGIEDYMSWSPDGQRIAYQADQSGNPDIWVAQIGGQAPVNRTVDYVGADLRPSWSPDGTQIGFLSSRDGPGYYTMSALGGPAQKVLDTHPNSLHRPQWSADGSELAGTVTGGDGSTAIEIVSLRSRESRRLGLPSADFGFDLSWSPDGRFFALIEAVAYNAEVSRLWILRVSDGSMVPLTDDRTAIWSPTWAPDAGTLYFVTNRGGTMDLWQQPLASDGSPRGPSEEVTTGIGLGRAALPPDGSKLAYSRGSGAANVWRVPILTDRVATWDDAEQVTFDQAVIELLDLSPDGQRLFVSSDRMGNHDLWELPVAGGEMRQLTTEPTPDWGPRVSPNGEMIAFYSYRSGNRDLWVMPVTGGAARQLTTHDAEDAAPSWSPDGQRITFASLRSGNWDV